MAASLWRRLGALALRHIYLLTGSWPRFVELFYWPMINMLVWGFVSLYLVKTMSNASVIGAVFVGGVLLSEILLRIGIGMMLLLLEEIWSRNFGHLFASPLRLREYAAGLLYLSLTRTLISLVPAVLVAKYLFNFDLFSLGWSLPALLGLLVMNGWWYGLLLLSILIRFGLAAEWIAWMSTWLIIPIVAPYYPVSILPGWLQAVSWSLPATYVFECMKALIAGKNLNGQHLLIALGLNCVYFAAASFIFYRAYMATRRRGGLLQMGE